jgi:hypothetical protein
MHPDAGPESWDAMWMHIMTGGGNTPSADMLVPVAREPSAVASSETPLSLSPRLYASTLILARGQVGIHFDLPNAEPVWLAVLDPSGRRIRELISGVHYSAGSHQVEWDARDTVGRSLVPGVYFYRLETGQAVRTRKVVVAQ